MFSGWAVFQVDTQDFVAGIALCVADVQSYASAVPTPSHVPYPLAEKLPKKWHICY